MARADGNPTWGDVYQYENGQIGACRIGIYKEYDYDYPYAAYAEKIWSILGKIMLNNCRVPDIDIIKGRNCNQPGVISYRLLDTSTEELYDMYSLAYRKFSSDQLKKMGGYISIADLFECVREEIKEDNNYRESEKTLVETIILDSISNNADRNIRNWGVVRDKNTGKYTPALFDHSISFINMLSFVPIKHSHLWTLSYLKTAPKEQWNRFMIGDAGNQIVMYLNNNYSEYFRSFIEKFNARKDIFYSELESLDLPIDLNIMKDNINRKQMEIQKMIERGEESERDR